MLDVRVSEAFMDQSRPEFQVQRVQSVVHVCGRWWFLLNVKKNTDFFWIKPDQDLEHRSVRVRTEPEHTAVVSNS